MRGRFRAGLAALAALLLAACASPEELRTVRRIPLGEPVGGEASLRVAPTGRVWVVEDARATVVDTAAGAGAPSRITVGEGTPLPAPAWDPAGRLYAEGAEAALSGLRRPGGGEPAERVPLAGPVARDPGGRWLYVATEHGGVVGLDARTLAPVWGWPEAGGEATALAVSPLGDRVYLALSADERTERGPRVLTLDAQSGRVLASDEVGEPVRALAAAPDGTLFGWTGAGEDDVGEALGLRPGPGGLEEAWSVSLGAMGLGLEGPGLRLRVSPAGDRVALLSAGGGLRLLDAADGTVVRSAREAPLDAAFDAAGRLFVLDREAVRIVR